ncbi:MAG: hypothetical protein HZB63_07450 [Deltaproteobacteria bacterium]|nr:hypothetical protein [Deltaproteobacteria bacterium]
MRSALLVFLLCFTMWSPPALQGMADNAPRGTGSTFEERQAAEKTSRSRYRNLEVVSLVLILAVGGGAILWAVRRK